MSLLPLKLNYLGDGNYKAAQGTSNLTVLASSDGPRVVLVQRYGYHSMKTTVAVTFDRALAPAYARDMGDYWIIGPAGRVIYVNAAVYDATTNTATLTPARRLNLLRRY